jgi:NDP-sugar pyrophosphorylase family protein
MHCIITLAKSNVFPRALRPIKGRASLDYIVDDVLLQKDITKITIIVPSEYESILHRHLSNTVPEADIALVAPQPLSSLATDDDVLLIQGEINTSLKLKDFISYFKQFKTVTKTAFDKQNPKEIPCVIIPKKYVSHIDHYQDILEVHTFNCGTGYATL